MIKIKKMKKVELHLHLDGSLRVETVYELLEKNGEMINKKNIEDKLKFREQKKNLFEYLKKFELPLKLMQNKENIERIAYELIEDLSKENYIYVEIRFAPHLHLEEGLSLEEVTESVLKGVKKGEADFGLKSGIILCVMRHLEIKKAYEILELAKIYINKGVVGIDLAGDEKKYPVKIFKNFFEEVKKQNINFTIHAGEAEGAFSIKDAIDLGAKRIGHGIRAFEDIKLLKEILEKKIVLEMCPKSNMQTGVLEDFSKYPIQEYIKMGINITINSDNRTVSNTNICNEALIIMKHFKVEPEEILIMMKNALKGSFLNKEEKLRLLKELR